MSDEDQKLLQAVRDWRPPKTLHPIAMQLYIVYEKHGNKFTPEAAEELRGLLNAYLPDLKALAEAIEGVARTMMYVTEYAQDKAGGAAIAEVMREYAHHFEPFWERVGQALTNVSADARGSFLDFLDKDQADKKAPAFGAAAPPGSVPLSRLAPPARPPPWAANKPKKK